MEEELQESGNGRRTFLKVCSAFLMSMVGIAYGIPLVRVLINTSLQTTVQGSSGLVEVGDIRGCKVNVPRKVAIKDSRVDAWTRYPQTVIGAVWVVRGEDEKIRAYSVICPHLGCGIDWDRDSGRFICPCHDSYFDVSGEVLSGPSPRKMDTLETDIRQGKLFVRYQKMKLGIAEKIPA